MRSLFIAAPLAFTAMLSVSPAAYAGEIAACGDLNIDASANCELKVSGGCEAECTPLKVTAACEASCDGGCTLTLPKCEVDCKAGCDAECKVNPGSFDCQVDCEAGIQAKCDAKCTSSADKSQCDASCKATFKAECSASCEAVPPSADCKVKCEAGCTGSCTGEANLDCQIDCQAGCVADVSGGCKAQCSTPEGALFCDGQFVDSDNLQSCLDALANLSVEVSGHAECSGNTCTAEGSISCTAAPTTPSGTAPWAAMGSAVLGIALAAGRRRRRR